MARPGITYAQVAQSAEALTAAGTNPTIAAIRQAMGGTGSPNTIHKHLSAWKGERPPATSPAAAGHELPAKLIIAIHDVISQAAASAKAEAEAEAALQQAQNETVELARAGEYIEAERDALLEQIEALKTERDQAQAVAAERAKEIERQALQIEQERATNKTALAELERARSNNEALSERADSLKKEVEGNRREIAITVKERTEAHERAAVMAAELKAAERRADGAEGRERATAAKLEKVEACMQMERQAAAEANKPKAPAKTSAKPVKKGKKPEEANPEQDDKATLPIKF